jgi:hypothetical protein
MTNFVIKKIYKKTKYLHFILRTEEWDINRFIPKITSLSLNLQIQESKGMEVEQKHVVVSMNYREKPPWF